MAKQTRAEKKQSVVDAFKKHKTLKAKEVIAHTGVTPEELKALIAELRAEGILVPDGPGALKYVAKAAAPAAAAAAAPAKVKVAPKKVVVEEEPELEEEEYTAEELDALYAEYEAFGAGKLNAKDKARFDEIEGVLEANNYFAPPAEEAGAEPEEEVEEDLGFGDDEPAVDLDDDPADNDDSDNDGAPAKGKGKAAPKVTEGIVVPPASEMFSMPYKTVDTLTVEELADRIVIGTEVAESLVDQGFAQVSELILRSVAKCRKQYNAKTAE